MITKEQITRSLNGILEASGPEKWAEVKAFQKIVWEEKPFENQDKSFEDIVGTLAYDLEYYEPDEPKRKQDASYYADDKLHEVIKEGLEKITTYK